VANNQRAGIPPSGSIQLNWQAIASRQEGNEQTNKQGLGRTMLAMMNY
jgi:hypothetical protein